jgi:hypothetical protein
MWSSIVSSREVEGNGPVKPSNPLDLLSSIKKGANSGGYFRKMRGMSN